MASVTFQGNTVTTKGQLPEVGTSAPDFTLVKADLGEVTLSELAGKNVVLNIFPSIDTGTCAMSVVNSTKKRQNWITLQLSVYRQIFRLQRVASVVLKVLKMYLQARLSAQALVMTMVLPLNQRRLLGCCLVQ